MGGEEAHLIEYFSLMSGGRGGGGGGGDVNRSRGLFFPTDWPNDNIL